MKLFNTIYLLFIGLVPVFANNILVQNVTTTGNNATNKTIQVQFDLSWDNSWRDAINWDAAWVFMKFKDANGVWQHAKLNQTGFNNGSGTANTVQVTADKIGSWIYRSTQGSGTFNSTNMQLQWNYGLSGLNDVTGLEVRVYAVEMVYVPQGDFNVAKSFNIPGSDYPYSNFGIASASGDNFPVINTKLSPSINYNDLFNQITLKIKGDAGLDTDNNGSIDNTTYPTGYFAFYCYKYEMTNQQYADFLNTLTASQVTTLGTSGITVTLSNGQYFSSLPNQPCGESNSDRFYAYADWSGLRPMTFLEFNKACYGPNQPILAYSMCGGLSYPAGGQLVGQIDYSNCSHLINNVGYLATASSTRESSGASYYGIMDLTGVNRPEPVIKLNYFQFSSNNGNGSLNSSGTSDISNWTSTEPIYIDQLVYSNGSSFYGFRYVRSAE
jgi:formylglycine-generating enzyme required for sulfatase activity